MDNKTCLGSSQLIAKSLVAEGLRPSMAPWQCLRLWRFDLLRNQLPFIHKFLADCFQWFSPLFWYAQRALSPQFWGTSNSGLPPELGGLRGANAPVEVAIEMCISGSRNQWWGRTSLSPMLGYAAQEIPWRRSLTIKKVAGAVASKAGIATSSLLAPIPHHSYSDGPSIHLLDGEFPS